MKSAPEFSEPGGDYGDHRHSSEAPSLAEVEGALRTIRLEPAPPRLARKVMESVRAAPQLPRYGFSWVDYLLSLLVFSLLVLVFFLDALLPPQLVSYLRLEALYCLQRLEFQPVLGFIWAGGTALAAGMIFLGSLCLMVFSRKGRAV